MQTDQPDSGPTPADVVVGTDGVPRTKQAPVDELVPTAGSPASPPAKRPGRGWPSPRRWAVAILLALLVGGWPWISDFFRGI